MTVWSENYMQDRHRTYYRQKEDSNPAGDF
jgi:hypothetical protein